MRLTRVQPSRDPLSWGSSRKVGYRGFGRGKEAAGERQAQDKLRTAGSRKGPPTGIRSIALLPKTPHSIKDTQVGRGLLELPSKVCGR